MSIVKEAWSKTTRNAGTLTKSLCFLWRHSECKDEQAGMSQQKPCVRACVCAHVCVFISLRVRMGTHTNASPTDSRVYHKSLGIKQSDTEWRKDSWNRQKQTKSQAGRGCDEDEDEEAVTDVGGWVLTGLSEATEE